MGLDGLEVRLTMGLDGLEVRRTIPVNDGNEPVMLQMGKNSDWTI